MFWKSPTEIMLEADIRDYHIRIEADYSAQEYEWRVYNVHEIGAQRQGSTHTLEEAMDTAQEGVLRIIDQENM
jgi:hypothetical protein